VNRNNNTMRLYMKENLSLYLFVSVLFLMGVIFGAMLVNSLSLEQKQDMTRYLGSFFQTIEQTMDFSNKQSFQQALFFHLKWIGLIWILGLSVVGVPLILILNFLKGVLIGFSVGYLVGQMSWKGLLFSLVSIAPQNLVIIPAIVICSVTAIAFSLYIIKNRFLQHKGTLYTHFVKYSMVTLAMGGILFGVALFEAYVSPTMMKWVTPMLVAFY
jgi:stage II sporulation protein M